MNTSTLARRGTAPICRAARRLFPLTALLLGSSVTAAHAAIPDAATQDPLFAKGYLVVTHYPGVSNTGDAGAASDTTAALNLALADAYTNNLVAYFPVGTYVVNDTLKAHTATGLPASEPGYTHATPRNALVIVGANENGQRPLLKLAPDAADFDDPGQPKPMLEFMNFNDAAHIGIKSSEKESEGYNQMLRGVNLDCSGHAGAIGLYFNEAQDSSIEDLRINATGAFAGIKALPGRGCVVANVAIEGGQYGIDTLSTGAAGSVITGIVLRNQTVSAVRYDGFVPLVIAGFEILTPAGSTRAAITTQGSPKANSGCINLLDGTITLGAEPTVAAIDNSAANNFYARNVYVTGGAKLVRSGGNTAVAGSGSWTRIDEYSHCDPSPADSDGKASWDLIDGIATKTPAPLGNGEVVSVQPNASAPPSDLATRHSWKSLPAVTDADTFDAFDAGIVPGATVSADALQDVINAHRKVFLRKGIYHLDGTITLRKDSVLFGAARHLTRIEVAESWKPTAETPMITTVDDPTATTYIGELSIGVDATYLANDWFNALDWQAGRDSIVHIGRVYREPAATVPLNRWETNPHSLLRIRNSGGGRWYHGGAGKTLTGQHAGYRILKVENTTEPLWFYGLNAEHPRGTETYIEVTNAQNIRLYGLKTEFNGVAEWEAKSVLVTFNNVRNVAQFGHGAIRNAVTGHGTIEFLGSATDRVLATLIAPQNDQGTATGDTLRENLGSGNVGITYPNVVSLYKRGNLTPADDALLSHGEAFYGSPSTGNAAPLVALNAPAPGAALALGPITITAAATDTDGSIAQVKFFANNASIGTATAAPYSISWTPPGAGSYALTAVAFDDHGATATSPAVNVSIIAAPPATPPGLTATAGAGQVALSWTAVADATSYAVKRATVSGGPYVTVATRNTADYTDTNIVSDTTYFYVVSATNVVGQSANSAEASATPASPTSLEITFASIGAEDGYVLESTPTSNVGGSILSNGTGGQATRVGDDTSARQYKSIFSFDTSTLPADAVIVGATLELRRSSLAGNATAVASFAPLRADISRGSFGTAALEITDFEAPATATNVATLSYPGANNAWAIGSLNAAGLGAINPTGRTQFRVYFTVPDNGNATTDLLGFFPGEAEAANRPTLRVTYSLPPTITTNPNSQTATVGDNISFQVAATGSSPLSFQWRRNGDAITGNATAQSRTLLLPAITTALAGEYDCIVTNPVGSATSTAATLTIAKAAAVLTLGDLAQTYTGAPRAASATTVPAALNVVLSYDGFPTPPTDAGSYSVTAAIVDPNYTGSASGTLVVARAPAAVTLGALQQTYDGAPHPVTAVSAPAGLGLSVTYDDALTPPINAGNYAVAAIVTDPNYFGSASGTLVVAKAAATITLAPLAQSYDGTPRIVTATTTPAELGVTVSYDGSSTAPTIPGTYTITASIDDPNYAGTTSDLLVVSTTALVRHAPILNGGLDGSAQVLTAESITLNGSAWVAGDLLVPGTPNVRLNGHPTYGGTLEGNGAIAPTAHEVTLNGNALLRHVVRRIDPDTMPTVSAPTAPPGTRNVTLNTPNQSAGDFATLRDLTLNANAGDRPVPAGAYGAFVANAQSGFVLGEAGTTTPAVYHLQSLTLNGGAKLRIVGPVVLVLGTGLAINGSVNSEGSAESLTVQLASGGLTLNGGAVFKGTVIAPAGTVSINGNATFTGRVVCDQLTINGNGLLEEARP